MTFVSGLWRGEGTVARGECLGPVVVEEFVGLREVVAFRMWKRG